MAYWGFIWPIYILSLAFAVSFAQLPRLLSPPVAGPIFSDGVVISWPAWSDESDDGIGPVTGYLAVARISSGDPNAEFTVSVDAGTNLTVKVGPLNYGEDYDIAIVCLDGDGNPGEPSPTEDVSISCGAVGPVTNVSLVSHSNDTSYFNISWIHPFSSNNCQPDSYMITYAVIRRLACPDPVDDSDVNITTIANIDGTTYFLQDLEYHAQYEVNITGVNILGPGESVTFVENTIDGAPIESPVPSLQDDLTAPGELHFNWTEIPCDKIQGKFAVYLSEIYIPNTARHSFHRNEDIDNRETVFRGLDGCTDYQFRVRVTNVEGAGPFSELITATTPMDVPGIVRNVTFSASRQTPTNMRVSWEQGRGCQVEMYFVEYTLVRILDGCEEVNSSLVIVMLSNETEINYTIEGLEPYSEYNVSVYASNFLGNSSKVERVAFTGEQVPTGIPGDILAIMVDYDTLVFNFSGLPCGTRHGNITRYNYELRNTDTGNVTRGTTTRRVIYAEGLDPVTEYGIKINAENSAGAGNFSEEVLQRTTEAPDSNVTTTISPEKPVTPDRSTGIIILWIFSFFLIIYILIIVLFGCLVICKNQTKPRKHSLIDEKDL